MCIYMNVQSVYNLHCRHEISIHDMNVHYIYGRSLFDGLELENFKMELQFVMCIALIVQVRDIYK